MRCHGNGACRMTLPGSLDSAPFPEIHMDRFPTVLKIPGARVCQTPGFLCVPEQLMCPTPYSSVYQTQGPGGMGSQGDLLIHSLQRSMGEAPFPGQDCTIPRCFPRLGVGVPLAPCCPWLGHCTLSPFFFVLHWPTCSPSQSQPENLDISVEGAEFPRRFSFLFVSAADRSCF